MIIDQLTPTASDNLTDELAVEQGTSTFKTTWQKILDMFAVSSGTPAMDGTGSQGSANTLSRSDHVHPSDTNKVDKAIILPAYTDLDDVTTSGFYRVQDNIVNKPTEAHYWSQLIVNASGDTVAQIYIDYVNADTYVRTYGTHGGVVTWLPWVKLGSMPTAATISLSSTWSGSDPYYQTVTVSGATVTANSKVDLQPSETQLATLINSGVTSLLIKNNNGTLTAYALGAKPSSMTVQCTVTEVIP